MRLRSSNVNRFQYMRHLRIGQSYLALMKRFTDLILRINHGMLRYGCRGAALTQSRSASGVYTGLFRYKPRQP